MEESSTFLSCIERLLIQQWVAFQKGNKGPITSFVSSPWEIAERSEASAVPWSRPTAQIAQKTKHITAGEGGTQTLVVLGMRVPPDTKKLGVGEAGRCRSESAAYRLRMPGAGQSCRAQTPLQVHAFCIVTQRNEGLCGGESPGEETTASRGSYPGCLLRKFGGM